MKQIKLSMILMALIAVVASCKKSDKQVVTQNPPVNNDTTALYVLDQGFYGGNNAALTFYDFSIGRASTDTFQNKNAFKLGDTGTDFIIYGGKMYVVMNVSGYVAVVNPVTAQLIDTISFVVSSVNKEPENIVGYGGNVFVSSTDGTVAVIDTATHAITREITVGTNPAQMIIYGTNLYVSNTGAISGSYDSTLSVIDLTTFAESKIVVGINPGYIAADNSGNLYVACAGDYGATPASLVKVNTTSKAVVTTVTTSIQVIRFYNNLLYATPGYLSTAASVSVLSPTDLSVVTPSFITDATAITAAYGLDIDAATGDVYVDDATDFASPGQTVCFDKTGKKKFSLTTGITPCKTILIHK
jgi:YVTN family beta-propeller protein